MEKLTTLKPGDDNALESLAIVPGKAIALFDESKTHPQPLLIAGIGAEGLYNELEPKNQWDLILLRPLGKEQGLDRKILSTLAGIYQIYGGEKRIERLASLRGLNYTVHYAWVGKEVILKAVMQEQVLQERGFQDYSVKIKDLCQGFET